MKKNILIGLLLLGTGLLGGWLIWGMSSQKAIGMHQMPDGSMMSNNGSNMQTMMHDMNAALSGKTGDEFDKTFLSEMIIHHEGAVEMAQAVLKNSKRAELIKLANDIISAQSIEINMMKNWQFAWFKKTSNKGSLPNDSSVDAKTGLRYPSGFTTDYSNKDMVVRYVKGAEFIDIAEKLDNDPTCKKFFEGEEAFGFCVKGYHGEASNDVLADLFINLNK